MNTGISVRRCGWLAVPATLLAMTAAPAGASAADCEFAWLSGNGSSFDSAEESGDFYDGAILPIGPGVDYAGSDIRQDAFDDYGIAAIDGTAYENPNTDGCTRDGRTNRFPADVPVSDIRVRPELYASKTKPLGRQLVTITNTGDTQVEFDFTFDGNLGSDMATVVSKSSSGNNTVNAADRWATTCEEDSEDEGCAAADAVNRDPELAHNWQRKGKKEDSADAIDLATDDEEFDVTFEDVKLGPGKSKSYMLIVQMARKIATANKLVKQVEDGPRYVFAGLSKNERRRIQNW
jgi:hypothetical protein